MAGDLPSALRSALARLDEVEYLEDLADGLLDCPATYHTWHTRDGIHRRGHWTGRHGRTYLEPCPGAAPEQPVRRYAP
jgi:hypothetical protein